MNDSRYTRAYAAANITLGIDRLMNASRVSRALNTYNLNVPAALKNPIPGGGVLNGHINHLLSEIPKRDHLAKAAELIEAGKDPDELLALHAGQQLRVAAAMIVVEKRSTEYVQQFADNADAIIRELRTKVFDPLIKKVADAVEAYGGGLDIDQAVTSRDFDRAKTLSEMHDGFGVMADLHELRQTLHHDKFVGNAAWFIEPLEVDGDPANSYQKTPDITDALWWASKIQSGFTPHWPTYAEYLDLLNTEAHKAHAEMISDRTRVFNVEDQNITNFTAGGRA